jgi:PAS domain S-box-containing protein
MKTYLDAFARHKPFEMQYRLKRHDGEYRWLMDRGQPRFDAAQQFLGFIGSVVDIHDSKLLLEENRALLVKLNTILNNIPGFIFELAKSPEGHIRIGYASEGFNKVLGFPFLNDGTDARRILNLIEPSERDAFISNLRKSICNTAEWEFEVQIRKEDNTLAWIGGRATPQKKDDGTIVWIGYTQDITDRKNASEALRQQKELLQTVIDTIPDAIYLKDRNYRKILANKAELYYSGYDTFDEILGETDADIFGEAGQQEINNHERRIIEEGASEINNDQLFVNHRGEKFHFLTTKIPLRNAKDEIVGLIGIGRDISQLKQLQLELEAKNAEFEAIFKAIPDLYFKINADGVIIRYFAGDSSKLYASPEFFINKNLFEVLPQDAAQKILDAVKDTLTHQRRSIAEFSLSIHEKNRSVRSQFLSH